MIGVLPDVETWKDYFNSRKTSRHRLKINKEFKVDSVYTTGLIITQLISSFPIDKIETISRVIKGLKIVEVSTDDYIWAGKISAYMRELKLHFIPSSVILHHRLSDIHQLEYLTVNYKNESTAIQQSLFESCRSESNLLYFMYSTANNKNYLGTGYRDKVKAVRFGLDSKIVFPFDISDHGPAYIYKKNMDQISHKILSTCKRTFKVYEIGVTVHVLNKEQFDTILKNNHS